jgi:hypothetical protein
MKTKNRMKHINIFISKKEKKIDNRNPNVKNKKGKFHSVENFEGIKIEKNIYVTPRF